MLLGSLSFDEEQTKIILQEWLKIVKGDDPIIDIRGYSFIDPLYVAMLITLKKGVSDDLKIRVDVDSPAYSYIQYILGWQGKSASTVVPIRIVDRKPHVNRFVDELLKSTNLSFDDWEDKDAFRYIIRELIDNALEHGGSPAIVCAQVFKNLGEVEIVVSDYGYGFLQTIARNHKVSTYEEAIKKALERKVSGSLQNMYGKSVRIRYQKSLWFRTLADSFCLMGDKGYRGLEYVHVCEDKPDKSIRQVVEAVNSQIKLFNGVSRWRNITTLLAYLQGYAIGYSFFRKSWLFK